jgi:hypothetical protein
VNGAESVDRTAILRKAQHEVVGPPGVVRVSFNDDALQKSRFEIGDGDLRRAALPLSVLTIRILAAPHQAGDGLCEGSGTGEFVWLVGSRSCCRMLPHHYVVGEQALCHATTLLPARGHGERR